MGSRTSLPETLASHREAIYRYVLGIVRDRATAEDLMQEALLRAHSKLSTLQDPARLTSWLYRIVIECLFGLRGHSDGLLVDPQLPSEWRSAAATRRFRGANIHVTCHRDDSVGETEVAVDFVDQGGKTKLVLTQKTFEAPRSTQLHNEGWSSSFDDLADKLAAVEIV